MAFKNIIDCMGKRLGNCDGPCGLLGYCPTNRKITRKEVERFLPDDSLPASDLQPRQSPPDPKNT